MKPFGNSKSYSITSTFTGSEYNLEILYPVNYDPSLEYQTVYLLDGDFYFSELADIVTSKYAAEIILIGIGYKNENKRETDYTYPADDMVSNSGGGEKYIQFINNELIPYVENSLLIKSSEKTLAGHSYGGYFALYQLFQQDYPNPFNNIIAASPSLFWHEAYMLDLENQFNGSFDTLSIKLFNTMGQIDKWIK